MKLSQMFPRRYATGADLQGKAVTLTIERVTSEKMRPQPGAPEMEKWVLYFTETKKGVVLNRTLALQVARCLGSEETDEWAGQRITLYPEPMTVAGKPRVAIRARAAGKSVADKLPESLLGEEGYQV